MAFETGRFTHADPATVCDRETFISYTDALLGNFRLGRGAAEWENGTLDRFAAALRAGRGRTEIKLCQLLDARH